MPGTTRPGVLSTAVLSVLTAGVVSALALSPEAPAPQPAPQAWTAPGPAPVVVVPAAAVAPLPLPSPAPEPAPAPPAPAPATEAPAPAAEQAPAAAAAPPADGLCGGPGWQQRRGEAALVQLRRPTDAAPFDVRFSPARDSVIGLATLHEGRLEVFVRPCGELSDRLLRHVVAHELGHLVDGARLSDADRAEWMTVRGIPAGTPWYGCNGCTDFATPAGDFAEVYAQWQRGASSNRSELAGAPSADELEQLAARFWG